MGQVGGPRRGWGGTNRLGGRVPGHGWCLHLLGFWLLLLDPVGDGAVALVEPFHAVGFEVDATGDILDILHVRPAGGRWQPARADQDPLAPRLSTYPCIGDRISFLVTPDLTHLF